MPAAGRYGTFEKERDGMKALKICGWLFLAVSAIHCLAGIFSGEFRYPSMRTLWLTAISAVSLILSIVSFIIPAAARRAGGK